MIEDHAGVAGMAGGENYNLKLFGELLEDLFAIGSDIDSGFNDLTCWELDGEFDIVSCVEVLVAVNEGLIQVKNDGSFI